MEIQVNTELVSKAIFDSLTPEKRDELIQGALEKLLHIAETDRYGREKKTNLQEIFEVQTARVCGEIVREEMSKPEVKAKIQAVVNKAVFKALDADDESYGGLIDSLATAIHNGWAKSQDRY